MMSKGSIGNFLADEQPLQLGQEIIRIGTMFPLHFTNLIFKLGSLSIICALLCFNAIWIYLGAWLFWLTLWFSGRTRHLTKSAAGHVIGLPNTTTPDFNFAACRQNLFYQSDQKPEKIQLQAEKAERRGIKIEPDVLECRLAPDQRGLSDSTLILNFMLILQLMLQLMLIFMLMLILNLLSHQVILICCTVTANLRPKSAIPTFFPLDDNRLGDIFPSQVSRSMI